MFFEIIMHVLSLSIFINIQDIFLSSSIVALSIYKSFKLLHVFTIGFFYTLLE